MYGKDGYSIYLKKNGNCAGSFIVGINDPRLVLSGCVVAMTSKQPTSSSSSSSSTSSSHYHIIISTCHAVNKFNRCGRQHPSRKC